ncbi:lytic transglycosylase domain-containing protein [bacterium]|nr:lytic transglycosylase domain-containing protein [bacterium]
MKKAHLFLSLMIAGSLAAALPVSALPASEDASAEAELTVPVSLSPKQKAEANPAWFMPAHSGPNMVNPYLTPARVLKHPEELHEEQTVLWEGRILKHEVRNGKSCLLLGTDSGSVEVFFPNPARNLEYDRTKFRVAVKGCLTYKDGRFQKLTGRSCILLEPPLEYSYKRWLNGREPDPTSFISWRILFHNPETPLSRLAATSKALVRDCQLKHIDLSLLASLLQIESAWDHDAVSVSGAQGLGQLMPKTAAGLNVSDPFDPVQNLDGASQMVSGLIKAWKDGDNPYASVLASYNAGPNLVKSLSGAVPPYAETTNYVYFIGYVRRDMQKQAEKYGLKL